MKSKLKAIDRRFFGGSLRNSYIKIHNLALNILTITFHTPKYFDFDGVKLKHFLHRHNVNRPLFRMTERSIELRLADIFLRNYPRNEVVEVGAVTPYYWPQRVGTIVDPIDEHPAVTHKLDWLKFDVSHKAVLSISTFEHIGSGDYGLNADLKMSELAIEKLFATNADFLVTWPGGQNKHLDLVVKRAIVGTDISLFMWQRGKRGNDWRWVPNARDLEWNFSYGPYWANTLLVLYRGPKLV
jgi:hypothetical protein